MKKIITFLLLAILFQLSGFAQDCEVSTDPFTNEKVVTSNYKKRSVYYELRNDTAFFSMRIYFAGEKNVTFKEGSSLFFKFENGKKLELLTIRDAFPSTTVSNGRIITTYEFGTTLNKKELALLANSKVELIRYPNTEGGFMDAKIKGRGNKKVAKAINTGANCMLVNIE